MQKLLTQQGTAKQYDFSKPSMSKPWKPIMLAQEAVDALRDHTNFLTLYGPKIKELSMVSI